MLEKWQITKKFGKFYKFSDRERASCFCYPECAVSGRKKSSWHTTLDIHAKVKEINESCFKAMTIDDLS